MIEHCKCGHDRLNHRYHGRCETWVVTEEAKPGEFPAGNPCRCARWDVSRLPETGERLEFGRHRLNTPEAETAPAWPSLATVQGRADAKFKREQKKVRV